MTSIEPTTEAQLSLDTKQQLAVDACCDVGNRVVAVTGAAGTGKTTILRTAYDAMCDAGYTVALAAPTGKAAKRIQEATGIFAMTVHRLLEYTHPGDPDPKTGKPVNYSFPRRTKSQPLDVDCVFVDEYSMVNEDMHRALFDALPNGGVIRVFGDNNQLPPIEEGRKPGDPYQPSPFLQLLNNPKLKSVVLDTVYRQGKDSGILLNLQQVLRGRMPTKNEQWTMQFTDSPVDKLREYIIDKQDEGIDFSLIDNQVITPQNSSWVGTVKLNTMIQGLFHSSVDEDPLFLPRNPWTKGAEEAGGEKLLRVFVGDKIIITRNMYDLNVYNGESGKIIEITRDGEVIIDFGDKEQAIPPVLMVLNRFGKLVEIDPRKDIDLGYAITTHKSQGSEYKNLVYMLNKSTSYMQSRRNFYTGASRGKDHVHIITDQRSLQISLTKIGN